MNMEIKMTYLDPRMQALVAALQAVKKRIHFIGHPKEPMNTFASSSGLCETYTEPDWSEAIKTIELALSEASKPLKEFAGLTSIEWRAIALLCCSLPDAKKETEACRQIAESLE